MWRYQGKDLTNNDSNQEINKLSVTLFWQRNHEHSPKLENEVGKNFGESNNGVISGKRVN